jgi:DNA-binding MarR family transcriptional regulator
MLAQAIIACAVIVPAKDGVMRPFYQASHYGMKNSVGYLIRRTANLILPQLEELFADASLTFSQWTVLMALREWGQSTAAELARDICHDAGAITRIVDELEERGLVARARSETDRRVVALNLTPQGLSLVENLLPRVVEHWNGLLSGFSHLEVKLLIKLMSRLTAAAEGKRDACGARGRKRHEGRGDPSGRHRGHRHRRGSSS